MSVMWKLPTDILHSVYGEWLGWEDLARLDIACVEKNHREAWLSSLTDLRISRGGVSLSDAKKRMFCRWLVNRKVLCVEEFPVSVSVLEDLVGGGLDIMESYCPALRSIEIDTGIWYLRKFDLSVFLSHCHNLQGVTVWMNTDRQAKQLSDVVMEVLVEKLRENSLVKISLRGIEVYEEHNVMVANLLQKHASRLRDLHISMSYGKGIDLIISTLIENKICPRALSLDISRSDLSSMNSLMSYLSLTGEWLEVLKIRSGVLESINDFVLTLPSCCPKLVSLEISGRSICGAENLLHLFEQCPHLQDVVIDKVIRTCNEESSVTIAVQGSNDDWAVCLSHVLRRRQYKRVTLRQGRRDHYMPVGILKPLLEPYQITLDAVTSEACLISLLRDLPHLKALHLELLSHEQFTDATLAAITEHAKSLTDLFVSSYMSFRPRFSDRMLTELIKSCELIESLIIRCCGLESLVAVSKHSSLSVVHLITESVSEEMLDGLLLDEKVKWPSTLKEGSIRSYPQNQFFYSFNKETHDWTKLGYH